MTQVTPSLRTAIPVGTDIPRYQLQVGSGTSSCTRSFVVQAWQLKFYSSSGIVILLKIYITKNIGVK
jgi:hypothetical protein